MHKQTLIKNMASQYSSNFVLIAALAIGITLAGCMALTSKETGSGVSPPGSDNQWTPFTFSDGDYYRYAIFNHAAGEEGWVSVLVRDKGDGNLEGRWEGELGGETLAVTTEAPADRFILFTRPQLIVSPPAVPFLATVTATWWEGVTGIRWDVGVKWSAVTPFVGAAAGYLINVTGKCSVEGKDGYSARWMAGARRMKEPVLFAETCVSPELPLALSVKVYGVNGEGRYEARLLEHRPGDER